MPLQGTGGQGILKRTSQHISHSVNNQALDPIDPETTHPCFLDRFYRKDMP